MKTATVFELRDNLASHLNDVIENKTTIIIYRYGKPIAVLSAIDEKTKTLSLSSFYGFMGPGLKGIGYENKIRRNKREKIRISNLRSPL